MRTFTRRLGASVLTAALAALVSSTVYGQEAPTKLRLAEIHVRAGQTADFEATSKLVNEAYKKAGIPWRETWSVSQFGQGGVYFLASPVKNYAQFDEDGPISKLSVEERLTYANLVRNAVESAHYKLLEPAEELSLQSERKEPPKLARVMVVHTIPGKAPEYEAAIKDLLLPALKAAGVKDYWVYRTLLGGPLSEITILLVFDKWADLDALPPMPKLLGANYGQYMSHVSASVEGAENMVVKLDPKLSYFPEQ